MSTTKLTSSVQSLVNRVLNESTHMGYDTYEVKYQNVGLGVIYIPFANFWRIDSDRGLVSFTATLYPIESNNVYDTMQAALKDFSLSFANIHSNFQMLVKILPFVLGKDKEFGNVLAEVFNEYYEGWYQETDNISSDVPSTIPSKVRRSSMKVIAAEAFNPSKTNSTVTVTLQCTPQMSKFLAHYQNN